VEVVICYVQKFRAKWAKTDGLKGLYFLGVGGLFGTPLLDAISS